MSQPGEVSIPNVLTKSDFKVLKSNLEKPPAGVYGSVMYLTALEVAWMISFPHTVMSYVAIAAEFLSLDETFIEQVFLYEWLVLSYKA